MISFCFLVLLGGISPSSFVARIRFEEVGRGGVFGRLNARFLDPRACFGVETFSSATTGHSDTFHGIDGGDTIAVPESGTIVELSACIRLRARYTSTHLRWMHFSYFPTSSASSHITLESGLRFRLKLELTPLFRMFRPMWEIFIPRISSQSLFIPSGQTR